MPDATNPTPSNRALASDSAMPVHDDVIGLIAHASDQEHGLACALLFVAASLKNDAGEGGLTDAQADVVRGWKRSLLLSARDRLRRVAQLATLTTALGGTPRLGRPAFPQPTTGGRGEAVPTLVPFSPSVVAHLAAGERGVLGLAASPAGTQVTERALDLGGPLVAVTDAASALVALGALVLQR